MSWLALCAGRSYGNRSIDRIVAPDRQLIEWIAKGAKQDPRIGIHETLAGLVSGKYQLLRYPNGIVITRVDEFNRLIVHLISGADWLREKESRMRDLIALADSLNVEMIEAYCRPGLEKPMRALGWKKEQVVMRIRRHHEQWRRND